MVTRMRKRGISPLALVPSIDVFKATEAGVDG